MGLHLSGCWYGYVANPALYNIPLGVCGFKFQARVRADPLGIDAPGGTGTSGQAQEQSSYFLKCELLARRAVGSCCLRFRRRPGETLAHRCRNELETRLVQGAADSRELGDYTPAIGPGLDGGNQGCELPVGPLEPVDSPAPAGIIARGWRRNAGYRGHAQSLPRRYNTGPYETG